MCEVESNSRSYEFGSASGSGKLLAQIPKSVGPNPPPTLLRSSIYITSMAKPKRPMKIPGAGHVSSGICRRREVPATPVLQPVHGGRVAVPAC